ncbi:MAG TPA: capsule assembly Wzi family protein [Roseivirga sp.]
MVLVKSGVLVRSQDFNPFYLVHNRLGMVRDHQDFFVQADLRYVRELSKSWGFKVELGSRNDLIYKSYASINWKNFSFFGGSRGLVLGGIENNKLTTGSLALGNNALPVPQIGVESDYFNLPFTQGYLQIKGGISHGWFEEDRYISGAFLHQKHAKIKIDLESLIGLRIYSSLIHFAQYGGVSSLGEKQPSSFSDFRKVFFGQGIPNPMAGTAGESNAVGNHVGVTEWTWDQRIGNYRLQINYQKPFEDEGSMQYLSFKDFLTGINLEFPESSKIKNIYFEWVRSLSQSGPGLPDPSADIVTEADNFGYEFGGRDDYYNNWLYQTGWTFKNRILSNPLFLTYTWALNFLPVFPNYTNQVINNRINAFHLGANIQFNEKLKLRSMFTYSVNYGTYAGLYQGRFAWNGIKSNSDFEYVFLGGKKQFYSLIDLTYQTSLFKRPVELKGMFAFDSGQLYMNSGMELAISYLLN